MNQILQQEYRQCIAEQSVALIEQAAEIKALQQERAELTKRIAELEGRAQEPSA